MIGARLWAWLWHGPQFRSWTEHVQIWGASEPQITPLATLPPIKALKPDPVPASWTWDKQQRRYVPPVKAKRQKPDNVTPMRQRQNG